MNPPSNGLDVQMGIRERMYEGLDWYNLLKPPGEHDDASAWRFAKDARPEWWTCLSRAALRFAERHGLWEAYRKRFAGIRPVDLSPARAASENRRTDFPIWEVLSELVVGAYLEAVLGWRMTGHEPRGNGERLGDFEFATPSGRVVFVEVKTIQEARTRTAGFTSVYAVSSQAPRLRSVIARAYRQLPDDGRANVVVVVGHEMLNGAGGLVHSDLFAALFGQFVINVRVNVPSPHVTYAGPSFRDMLIHHTKRRRLSTAVGLIVSGLFAPAPLLYAIHNPFAHDTVRLISADFGSSLQFCWHSDHGAEEGTPDAPAAWEAIARKNLLPDDGCAPEDGRIPVHLRSRQ